MTDHACTAAPAEILYVDRQRGRTEQSTERFSFEQGGVQGRNPVKAQPPYLGTCIPRAACVQGLAVLEEQILDSSLILCLKRWILGHVHYLLQAERSYRVHKAYGIQKEP